MKTRKLICFVAAVACALSLAACSGKADTTTAAETTTEAAPAGAYVPGTYTAEATGMGKITVTVTVNESGDISECVIDASNETPGIGVEAAAKLQDAVVEAQSAEIDAVSGATVTSNAVITAVTDCLTQASAQ